MPQSKILKNKSAVGTFFSERTGLVRRKTSKAKDQTIINLNAQLAQLERERERG